MMYPLVRDFAADGIPVAVTYRVLGFTTQAFYAWRKSPVSQRDWDNAQLLNLAIDIHADDPGFGYRFTADELPARGISAGENRVARLCSAQRVWSVHATKRGTHRKAGPPVHDDLLAEFPDMPATVIAERIGWERSASVLRARVAQLRPLFRAADPADRTTYVAGEIVQCDLWFPGKVVPVGPKATLIDPPVLTMAAAFSGFIMALLLPTRTTGELVAGMWALLSGLGAVPKVLVWDNESGIGQHRHLTVGARSFAGTLGLRIYQTAPRDPESKGVIERANGFLETSFMPGRTFSDPADYNTQLAQWLPKANSRVLRRTGDKPGVLIAEDTAAMRVLPPVAPVVGTSTRVRLGRDYYVRIASNDYSVNPTVIGRFVDVHAGLTHVVVSCAGAVVATHVRCWAVRQTITDPAPGLVVRRARPWPLRTWPVR